MFGIIQMSCFLSWFMMQLMFMNFITSGYSIMFDTPVRNESKELLDRSKRSINSMPIVLRLRIKYSSGEETELNLLKQPQHLANKHLPVVAPIDYPYSNVMKRTGEFLLYHDLETCSAFVYFEKSETLAGVIGLDYTVWKSPFQVDNDGNHQEIIEEPYLSKYLSKPAHNQPVPVEYPNSVQRFFDHLDGKIRRPSDSEPGPSGKRQRIEPEIGGDIGEELADRTAAEVHNIRKRRWSPLVQDYYIEILVFVSQDIVELLKQWYGPQEYVDFLIRDQITYFNAVDMTFHQLHKNAAELNINIAKIVIENNVIPLGFTGKDRIDLSETYLKTREYLSTNRDVYPVDSFDHVFIFTSRAIVDGNVPTTASTQYVMDLYQDRKNGHPYNGVPITVISYESNYAVAVHEISRSLGIQVDPPNIGLEVIGQCSSIMQQEGSKCNQCLKWTPQQNLEFQSFAMKNYHRCFLLNKPRSVRPPGPSKFVSPVKQCRCFDYDFYFLNGRREYVISSKQCHQPLQCGKHVRGQVFFENTLLPFDGAPCGKWNEKVCWAGVCTKLKPQTCDWNRELY